MQLIFFFKSSALFKRLSQSHRILYNLRIIQPYVSFIILFLIIGGCDSNQIWIDKTKTFELLYEEGKFIQAKVIAEEALQIAREGYKDDNLNIISSHINLGNDVARILTLADVAWRPKDNEMENVIFDDYDWEQWKRN